LKQSIKQFVKGLKDKELVIFRERILADAPLTLREIGERYGITRERVRQIEERVKKKIQAYVKMKFKDLRETRIGSCDGLSGNTRDASPTNLLKKNR